MSRKYRLPGHLDAAVLCTTRRWHTGKMLMKKNRSLSAKRTVIITVIDS
jgi:hypothetical protein